MLGDFLTSGFRPKLEEQHRRRIAGEDMPKIFEYEGLRKDGTTSWFEARVSVIITSGEIKGTQYAVRDINDEKQNIEKLKRSEAEKTQLLDELTKKYNELMQFNYIVSHNLRAPIANIMGLSEIINYPDNTDAERSEILENIRTVSCHMDELIKDLNTILSLNSQLNEKMGQCSLPAVIERISDTLEMQIRQSGAIITKDIPEETQHIVSIKSYIESILFNLISNAIKYKSPKRVPEIKISVRKSNNEFTILVTDNGMGIDIAKHGANLFGLFYRVDTNMEGKGLGLHMVKVQAEALGGRIDIVSELNIGSTFTITLPGR